MNQPPPSDSQWPRSQWNRDEQAVRDSMRSRTSPDESINDQHQRELRDAMLAAFDSSTPATPLQPLRSPSRSPWIAIIVGLAACVVAIISLSLAKHGDGTNGRIAIGDRSPTGKIADAQFKTIERVTDFQDDVSTEDFFLALAICEHVQQADAVSLPRRQ